MCAVKIGRLGKFDLNPRGELWRRDENRFGRKLLSKFGWSQGKGLGKNEDGVAENLKVKIKMGYTGVGWDEKLPIGIDYREYDAVLNDLSKRFTKPGGVKDEEISLEKRSQEFKNRIHYQKFVRGKDISRYSEKDMSCIFLSRENPEEEMKNSPKDTTVTNTESRPVGESAKESVSTFNSHLSIADYFAMKMKNKTRSSLNTPKESKTYEEFSEMETGVKSIKRKLESKGNKKVKRIKHASEFSTGEESLSYEEEGVSSEFSSLQEAPEKVLVSDKQFQNEEECEYVRRKKKSSKKIKKLLNAFKSKQDIENNQQEEHNVVEKNSTQNKSFEDQSEDTSSNLTEESNHITEKEVTSKERKKEQKRSKKAKKLRLEEAEISTGVEKNSSHSVSDEEGKNSELLNACKSKKDIENTQHENNTAWNSSPQNESLENQSQYGSSNLTEESHSVTEKEVSSKNRKKERYLKAKKRCLEEAEIFTSVEKNSSHGESDEKGNNSKDCVTKSVKIEEQSHKEAKKPKSKIFNLKSCLVNNKYNFKEKRKVSFCENISYKLIENVCNNFDSDVILETNEQLLSCSDEDCTDSEIPNETENVTMNHIDDSSSFDKSSNGDVQYGVKGVSCHENTNGLEDNAIPECFKLPKCIGTNYDSWLETQRIAARMKVYKNMAKKMKKHPVLRKTNLLEIKGYGNWGI